MRLSWTESVQRTTARVDEQVCAVARGPAVTLMIVEDRAETTCGDGCGRAGVWYCGFIHCNLGIRRRNRRSSCLRLPEEHRNSRRDAGP